MIRAYVGRVGEGKTLSMINDAILSLDKTDVDVFTNVPFINYNRKGTLDKKRQPYYCSSLELEKVIVNCSNALIVLDEANIVFPSYFWTKLSVDYIRRFSENRKYKMDLYYTTQMFKHVVTRLRDLTNEVVKCSKNSFFGLTSFTNICYDPEYFDKLLVSDRIRQQFIIRERKISTLRSKHLFKCYDTYHLIKDSTLTGSKVNTEKLTLLEEVSEEYQRKKVIADIKNRTNKLYD